MTYQLVTCPETAHLEMIEYEDDPLGLLIVECSQFRPPCCLTCPRTCARRLDRREGERVHEVEQITRVEVTDEPRRYGR